MECAEGELCAETVSLRMIDRAMTNAIKDEMTSEITRTVLELIETIMITVHQRIMTVIEMRITFAC
jgi:hypothetical protein